MSRPQLLIVVGAVTAVVFSAPATSLSSAASNTVVFASAQNITVGGYHVWGNRAVPNYANAIRVYGESESCNLLSYAPGNEPVASLGQAQWQSLGVRIRIATLGGLPDGGDVCTSPKDGQLDKEWVTGRQWRTAKGLRIGDPISKLRRLYPKATRHRNTWWMVTHYTPIADGFTQVLFAVQAKGGRVDQFVFNIGAQGE